MLEPASILTLEFGRRLRLHFQNGNAGLDVKASILLVVIAFLATLVPSVFQVPGLSVWLKVSQAANAVVFAVGVAFLVGELRPRKYLFEDGDYLADLHRYIKKREAALDDATLQSSVEKNASLAIGRIQRNCELNSAKERLLKYSFRLVIAGLSLQILILLAVAIHSFTT